MSASATAELYDDADEDPHDAAHPRDAEPGDRALTGVAGSPRPRSLRRADRASGPATDDRRDAAPRAGLRAERVAGPVTDDGPPGAPRAVGPVVGDGLRDDSADRSPAATNDGFHAALGAALCAGLGADRSSEPAAGADGPADRLAGAGAGAGAGDGARADPHPAPRADRAAAGPDVDGGLRSDLRAAPRAERAVRPAADGGSRGDLQAARAETAGGGHSARTPRRIDRLVGLVGLVGEGVEERRAAGLQVVRAAGLSGMVRPASEHTMDVVGATRTLPVLSELRALLPGGGLRRGATIAVHTSSVLLALLVAASKAGSWCAVVGLPALSPIAAAEMGISLDRLALVPYPGTEWTTTVAALLDGLDIVVAAPPGVIAPAVASRLAARARQRGSVLMPAGAWAGADLTVAPVRGVWDGLRAGRGRLRCREMTIQARGRGAAAAPREVTLWLPALEGVLPPISHGLPGSVDRAGDAAGEPGVVPLRRVG